MVVSSGVKRSGPALSDRWWTAAAIGTLALGVYLAALLLGAHVLLVDQLLSDLSAAKTPLAPLSPALGLSLLIALVPLGIAVDYYGPWRLLGIGLCLVAAGFALLSETHDGLAVLAARSLIGVAIGSVLPAGLKAVAVLYGRAHVGRYSGVLVAIGALGLITVPFVTDGASGVALSSELRRALAGLAAVLGLGMIVAVRDANASGEVSAPRLSNAHGLADVWLNGRLWRLLPVSALIFGAAWALPGPWMMSSATPSADANGLAEAIFFQGLAFGCGALAFGLLTELLRRAELRPHSLFVLLALLAAAAEMSLATNSPWRETLSLMIVALAGAGSVLTLLILAGIFPIELVGRVIAVAATLHLATALALQALVSALAPQMRYRGGVPAALAYEQGLSAGLATVAGLTVAAMLWFWRPWTRLSSKPITTPLRSMTANERIRTKRPLHRRPVALAAIALVAGTALYNADVGRPLLRDIHGTAQWSFSQYVPAWLIAGSVPGTASQSLVTEQQATIRGLQTRLSSAERELNGLRPQLETLRRQASGTPEAAQQELAALRPQFAELNRQTKIMQEAAQQSNRALSQAQAEAATRREALTAAEAKLAALTSVASVAAASQPGDKPVNLAAALVQQQVNQFSVVRTSAIEATAPGACATAAQQGPPLVLQFDRSKDTLEFGHHKTLNEIVGLAIACPRISLQIRGYSDSRGTPRLNAQLSQRRAELTAKFLEAHGVKLQQMHVLAMGDRDPIGSNVTDEGRARNRRVEVRLQTEP